MRRWIVVLLPLRVVERVWPRPTRPRRVGHISQHRVGAGFAHVFPVLAGGGIARLRLGELVGGLFELELGAGFVGGKLVALALQRELGGQVQRLLELAAGDDAVARQHALACLDVNTKMGNQYGIDQATALLNQLEA